MLSSSCSSGKRKRPDLCSSHGNHSLPSDDMPLQVKRAKTVIPVMLSLCCCCRCCAGTACTANEQPSRACTLAAPLGVYTRLNGGQASGTCRFLTKSTISSTPATPASGTSIASPRGPSSSLQILKPKLIWCQPIEAETGRLCRPDAVLCNEPHATGYTGAHGWVGFVHHAAHWVLSPMASHSNPCTLEPGPELPHPMLGLSSAD